MPGRRPWLSEPDASCDQVPRTLQRGASNVWFSLMHSAISIPPWSEGAFLVLNKHWEMLRHLRDQAALRASSRACASRRAPSSRPTTW